MPFFISIRNMERSNLHVLNLFRILCRPSRTHASFCAAMCKFKRPKHTPRTFCRISPKLRSVFVNGFMPFFTDIKAINSVISSFPSLFVVHKLRAQQVLLTLVVCLKTQQEGRHSRKNQNISLTQSSIFQIFNAILP